jgi:hypothetical protein
LTKTFTTLNYLKYCLDNGEHLTRRVAVSAFIVLSCLALVAVLAFSQGKAYAEKKGALEIANDDAFYSLYALKALKDPQDARLRTLFQVSLDAAVFKLFDISASRPGLIKPRHYNLLVAIRDYLKQDPRSLARNPALRPLNEVQAKVEATITRLESIRSPRAWEELESRSLTPLK